MVLGLAAALAIAFSGDRPFASPPPAAAEDVDVPAPPPGGTAEPSEPERPAAAPAASPKSLGESFLESVRLKWNFSWQAGLNYEITKPLLLGQPGEPLEGVIGEEMTLRGHIGGKLAVDAAVFARTGSLPSMDDGVELRRLRIYTTGELLAPIPIAFKFEMAVVQGADSDRPNSFRVSANEMYLALRDIPYLGTLYVGNLQTPVGLEGVTSSRDLTFMEPAAPGEAFLPGIKAGAMLQNDVLDGRATWSVGMFANTLVADFGNLSDLASVMGRVTWLPIYRPEAERPTLLHLGLSASYGFSGGGVVRNRARPEAHLAPFLLDTGDIEADRALVAGAEVAAVLGPASLQAELYYSFVNPHVGQNLSFMGGYLSASYFLTGESRSYDTATGVFNRLKPRRALSLHGPGWGALEVALRYSYLDLNDGAVHGGRSNIAMAGLNWYLSAYTKLRLNCGYAAVAGPVTHGGLFIVQTRVEIDF